MDPWDLVFQAGMVGAFIYYALRRDRHEADERKERDKQWQGFLEKQGATFVEALQNQDKDITEALQLDRTQRKEGMEMGTGYVNQLADAVTKMAADLSGAIGDLANSLGRHEGLAEIRHGRTLRAIQALQKTQQKLR
jgi:hypothetical protein